MLLLLHGSEWVLTHTLRHHHIGLELLLQVGRHHLHHLVLLRHVHLCLLLLVTHRIGDEAHWFLLLLRLLHLLLGHLIHHGERVIRCWLLDSVHDGVLWLLLRS